MSRNALRKQGFPPDLAARLEGIFDEVVAELQPAGERRRNQLLDVVSTALITLSNVGQHNPELLKHYAVSKAREAIAEME